MDMSDLVATQTTMDTSDKKKIAQLEQQILTDKPWQLRGEVGAKSRPLNSLLFEDVKYEQQAKAPKITAESTESLEALIRNRIKNNQFDDPVRKVKPATAFVTSRQVEVSSEKSKVGLAQIYEQELIAKSTSGQIKDGPEKETERKLYALFRKLDSLVDR